MSCTLERAQPEPLGAPPRPDPYAPRYTPPAARPAPRQGFLLRTPYDEYFVAELKQLQPERERQWTGEAWWIAQRHEAKVITIVIRIFWRPDDHQPDRRRRGG